MVAFSVTISGKIYLFFLSEGKDKKVLKFYAKGNKLCNSFFLLFSMHIQHIYSLFFFSSLSECILIKVSLLICRQRRRDRDDDRKAVNKNSLNRRNKNKA